MSEYELRRLSPETEKCPTCGRPTLSMGEAARIVERWYREVTARRPGVRG